MEISEDKISCNGCCYLGCMGLILLVILGYFISEVIVKLFVLYFFTELPL